MSKIADVLDAENALLDDLFSLVAARPNSLLILVEGPTDSRTYRKIFPEIRSTPTEDLNESYKGRESVKKIISMIDGEKFSKNIRGVVDKDLDIEKGNGELSKNIFVTDYADLEMYGLSHPDFHTMIEEVLKIDNRETYAKTIERCIELVAPLGAIRVEAHKRKGKIHHENFDYAKTGKKAHITSVELSQSELFGEITQTLIKLNIGSTEFIKEYVELAQESIQKYDAILFVKSTHFVNALLRLTNDHKQLRSGKKQYQPEALSQDARKFLKGNVEIIRQSTLGVNLLKISQELHSASKIIR